MLFFWGALSHEPCNAKTSEYFYGRSAVAHLTHHGWCTNTRQNRLGIEVTVKDQCLSPVLTCSFLNTFQQPKLINLRDCAPVVVADSAASVSHAGSLLLMHLL